MPHVRPSTPVTRPFKKTNEAENVVILGGEPDDEEKKKVVGGTPVGTPVGGVPAGTPAGTEIGGNGKDKNKAPGSGKGKGKAPGKKSNPLTGLKEMTGKYEPPGESTEEEPVDGTLMNGTGLPNADKTDKKVEEIKAEAEEAATPEEEKERSTEEVHVSDAETPGKKIRDIVSDRYGIIGDHIPQGMKDTYNGMNDAYGGLRDRYKDWAKESGVENKSQWALSYTSDFARGIGATAEGLNKGLGVIRGLVHGLLNKNLFSDPMSPMKSMVDALEETTKVTDDALDRVADNMGIKRDRNGNIQYDPALAAGTLKAVNYKRRIETIKAGEGAFYGIVGDVLGGDMWDADDPEGSKLRMMESLKTMDANKMAKVSDAINKRMEPYINGLRNKERKTEADRYMIRAYDTFTRKMADTAYAYARDNYAQAARMTTALKLARSKLKQLEGATAQQFKDWYNTGASNEEKSLVDALGGLDEFYKRTKNGTLSTDADGNVHLGISDWRKVQRRASEYLMANRDKVEEIRDRTTRYGLDKYGEATDEEQALLDEYTRQERIRDIATSRIDAYRDELKSLNTKDPTYAEKVKQAYDEMYKGLDEEERKIADLLIGKGDTRKLNEILKYYDSGLLSLHTLSTTDLDRIVRNSDDDDLADRAADEMVWEGIRTKVRKNNAKNRAMNDSTYKNLSPELKAIADVVGVDEIKKLFKADGDHIEWVADDETIGKIMRGLKAASEDTKLPPEEREAYKRAMNIVSSVAMPSLYDDFENSTLTSTADVTLDELDDETVHHIMGGGDPTESPDGDITGDTIAPSDDADMSDTAQPQHTFAFVDGLGDGGSNVYSMEALKEMDLRNKKAKEAVTRRRNASKNKYGKLSGIMLDKFGDAYEGFPPAYLELANEALVRYGEYLDTTTPEERAAIYSAYRKKLKKYGKLTPKLDEALDDLITHDKKLASKEARRKEEEGISYQDITSPVAIQQLKHFGYDEREAFNTSLYKLRQAYSGTLDEKAREEIKSVYNNRIAQIFMNNYSLPISEEMRANMKEFFETPEFYNMEMSSDDSIALQQIADAYKKFNVAKEADRTMGVLEDALDAAKRTPKGKTRKEKDAYIRSLEDLQSKIKKEIKGRKEKNGKSIGTHAHAEYESKYAPRLKQMLKETSDLIVNAGQKSLRVSDTTPFVKEMLGIENNRKVSVQALKRMFGEKYKPDNKDTIEKMAEEAIEAYVKELNNNEIKEGRIPYDEDHLKYEMKGKLMTALRAAGKRRMEIAFGKEGAERRLSNGKDALDYIDYQKETTTSEYAEEMKGEREERDIESLASSIMQTLTDEGVGSAISSPSTTRKIILKKLNEGKSEDDILKELSGKGKKRGARPKEKKTTDKETSALTEDEQATLDAIQGRTPDEASEPTEDEGPKSFDTLF